MQSRVTPEDSLTWNFEGHLSGDRAPSHRFRDGPERLEAGIHRRRAEQTALLLLQHAVHNVEVAAEEPAAAAVHHYLSA